MHRKTHAGKTEKFSAIKEYPEIEMLRRKAARWAQDNFAAIRDAVPQNFRTSRTDLWIISTLFLR